MPLFWMDHGDGNQYFMLCLTGIILDVKASINHGFRKIILRGTQCTKLYLYANRQPKNKKFPSDLKITSRLLRVVT